MGQDRIKSRRYQGVYYRESTVATHRGRPDRSYWIAYRDARGKLCWLGLGRASEGVTEEFAHRKRNEIQNLARHGEILDAGRRRQPVLDDVFAAYMENARLLGKHTGPEESRYRTHLRPAFGRHGLPAITDDALTRHKAALLERLSPQTVKHALALLRRVVNYGLRKKMWTGHSPFGAESDFTMPRVENRSERFLSRPEADALLDELAKRSGQLADMARLSLATALRATEIFGLRAQDLSPRSNTLHIVAKGGARQGVYVSDDLLRTLLAYGRRPGEHIFQRRDGGPVREVYGAFQRAVDALGLNAGVSDPRQRVIFHTLRHTAISWWAQSGRFTLIELMELARHRRIETTLRYAHLIPGGVRDKLRSMHADAPDQWSKPGGTP